MRILMLTDRMDGGGAETHVASLCRALRARGDTVTLLSAGGRIADALEREGVRRVRVPPFSRSPLRLLRILCILLLHLSHRRYDVLHAHARLPALLLRFLPRRMRERTAVTVHARFRPTRASRRLSYWGRATVAVSEDLRIHTARAFARPWGSIRVIPNGIELDRFTPAGRVPLEASARRLLFVSRLDGDCALGARLLCRVLPRLAERFPDVTLTVAGGGDAYEEILVLADASNRTLGRRAVTLTGYTEDTASLYRTHGILIGVSRVALEGAACGCAAVLLGDEGYLGILEERCFSAAWETNLTCRDCGAPTEEALEADLLRLLSDVDATARIAARGCAWVREHFDLSRTAEATRRLYRTVRWAPHAPRLLIGGYAAMGNVGDDAILLGVRAALAEHFPDVRLSALTGHGRRDGKLFSIPCYRRHSPLAILRGIKGADLFLCGGGSLLQNKTSNRSLLYYLSLLRLAHALGVPPLLFAAGIGPLQGERARRWVRSALALSPHVSLRDPDSARLLRACGVTVPLSVGADPALLCPLPSAALVRRVRAEHALSDAPYLCLALRGEMPAGALLSLCRELLRTRGVRTVLLVLDVHRDAALSRRVGVALSAPVLSPDVDTLLALLAGAELVLSARLHGLILAASVGTPAVALRSGEADPKLASFAALIGARVADVGDSACLARAVTETLEAGAPFRDSLAAQVGELRKKAQKDLENVVQMLYNIHSIN